MPRERKTRIGAHEPSAKLSKRSFAVQENAVEAVEVGVADDMPGQDILTSLNAMPPSVSKKDKQQLKHDAFVDRIRSPLSTTPYSKAQRRRFNKKRREQVGGGLDSIGAVISALEGKRETELPVESHSTKVAPPQHRPQAKEGAGLIGAGKGVPLTKAQRKRMLEMEKFRHPLILTNPHYAANPFQTIRTHAQNTLEKHTPGV